MNRQLLILLAAVTLSVAMVPRVRRAVYLGEDDVFGKSKSQNASKICMPQTPCAWSVYKSQTKIIDTTIVNTYCTCASGKMCLSTERDISGGYLAHHCKTPATDDRDLARN